MTGELQEVDFQRLWRKLQNVGLNAYEARAYLAMVGQTPCKALALASRARVPRQKIYEVLDSLIEKGFAVVQRDKTKVFSAVTPGLAIPSYILQRGRRAQQELQEQARLANGLVEDLAAAQRNGQQGRSTLDFIQILTEPSQIAEQYRRLLSRVHMEYIEFSRAPYAVDPLEEQLVREAHARGVRCRLLVEEGDVPAEHEFRLKEYQRLGIDVRRAANMPMKLALFDGEHGLMALLDGVLDETSWTSMVFSHRGLGEAFQGLFESRWQQAVHGQSARVQLYSAH